ncbi:hypothetical protein [Alienimonas sp. DA493]|uniref:hypothetical protein n=1 Tax=Alienimonas sp. DA493 TaxID=3373605 RepID=UPI003754B54D
MSRTARLALGFGAVACGTAFLLLAATPGFPARARWGMAACAGFNALVAAAALSRRTRPYAVRAIGLLILALFAGYVTAMWRAGGWADAFRATLGLVVLGLPAGYVAWTGRYPRWGQYAEVFAPAAVPPASPTGRLPP